MGCVGGGAAVLNRIVRGALTERVVLEQRHEGGRV